MRTTGQDVEAQLADMSVPFTRIENAATGGYSLLVKAPSPPSPEDKVRGYMGSFCRFDFGRDNRFICLWCGEMQS